MNNIRKKLFACLVAVMILATFAPSVLAEEEVTIGPLKYSLDSTSYTATVLGFAGDASAEDQKVLNIPAFVTYGGKQYTVTEIGKRWGAFRNNTNLESVFIPSTITGGSIQQFEQCTNLKTVTIDNAAMPIAKGMFSECSSLETVDLGSRITAIESTAFENCTSLRNITIPESVSGPIYYYTFWNTAILHIVFPSQVTSVDSYNFGGCTSLQEVVYGRNISQLELSSFDTNDNYPLLSEAKNLSAATLLHPDPDLDSSKAFWGLEQPVTVYGYPYSTLAEQCKKSNNTYKTKLTFQSLLTTNSTATEDKPASWIDQEGASVTITNHSTELANKTFTFDSPSGQNYRLQFSSASMAPGQSVTMTILPQYGLPVGEYSETVVLTETIEVGGKPTQVKLAEIPVRFTITYVTEIPQSSNASSPNVPRTGDDSRILLWAALMGLSLAAAAVLRSRRMAG